MLGTTGISGAHSELAIEQFCNDAAGEFLLPRSELGALRVQRTASLNDLVIRISAFAAERHISRAMVAYKLYRADAVPLAAWQALDNRFRQLNVDESKTRGAKQKEKRGGPNYYVVRRHRLGHALMRFTRASVDDGSLTPTKAARVLGVKPRTVYPLLFGGATRKARSSRGTCNGLPPRRKRSDDCE